MFFQSLLKYPVLMVVSIKAAYIYFLTPTSAIGSILNNLSNTNYSIFYFIYRDAINFFLLSKKGKKKKCLHWLKLLVHLVIS